MPQTRTATIPDTVFFYHVSPEHIEGFLEGQAGKPAMRVSSASMELLREWIYEDTPAAS